MKIKLSIIIVHYKVKEELFICLDSIYNSQTKFIYEVLVVDNDENKTIKSDLKNKYPSVHYIESHGNIGFGAGNNLGANQASGEYILFLNPDTKVSKYALNELITFLDQNSNTGIVAPLLLNKNNQPYPFQGTKKLTPLRGIFALSFINKLFPKNPISQEYWLVDWDKKLKKEVDVIPGTAFMIRKNVFEKAGKFDEHFFMYYEESDLCNSVRKLGEKIYILPSSTVYHAWGSSTKKSKKNIHQIFSQSQFYYFKKNYGLFWALLVKLFTEFGKEQLIFLLILALGILLRFYRIEQNFSFDAEVGDNLLDIKNAFIHEYIPLKGPPTSHPWLSFGPLFYWLYGPILMLAKFNPISHAYFGLGIGIITIFLNYYFIKRIFSHRVALLSTYVIAVSPLYMFITRLSRFTFIVALLIYPFLWMVKKIIDGESKYFFWLCLLLGIMLNFHYTPLILIPFVLTMLSIKKTKLSQQQVIQGFVGFLIPLIPILIFDSMHKFEMVKNLSLWIPYRILGFLGLYHKNTFSQTVLHENTYSFLNFFFISFLATSYPNFSMLGFYIFILLVCFTVWKIIRSLINKHFESSWVLLISWGFWGFLAVFIHGSPPLHYFVPLLPLPIILFSLFMEYIWDITLRYGKFIVIGILLILTIVDLQYYFSSHWYFVPDNKIPLADGYISYESRKKIVQFIIRDAKGQSFRLRRIGYNDIFEKQYSQNYIYLLWYYGNEPVNKAHLRYTILENGSKLSQIRNTRTKEFIVNNVMILKDE